MILGEKIGEGAYADVHACASVAGCPKWWLPCVRYGQDRQSNRKNPRINGTK